MHHPFLDAKNMSDDEILNKIAMLNQRVMYAQGMIGDRSMIMSLGQMIETLQCEYEERMAVRAQAHWDKQFPDIIESDPDFKKTKEGKKAAATGDALTRPSFNRKFVKPNLDITPVPTKHAPKDDSEESK